MYNFSLNKLMVSSVCPPLIVGSPLLLILPSNNPFQCEFLGIHNKAGKGALKKYWGNMGV